LAYGYGGQWFGGDDPTRSSLWIKIAAGATAGTIGGAIANPTDVIMIRMQAPFVATNIAGEFNSYWMHTSHITFSLLSYG
jgi:hypothetical protein